MAALHREGEVLGTKENGARVDMEVRVPRAVLGRLSRRPGIEIQEVS
jgi:hypothetical protein